MDLQSNVDDERLDRFVAGHMPGVSRSRVQRWILDGRVLINGVVVQKPSYRLSAGDVVRVPEVKEHPPAVEPWDGPLDVLYEDAECLVVNKPAGMVIHPAAGHRKHTLVNVMLHHYPELSEMLDPATVPGRRPGIVHRLDRDTSGVLVVARNASAWRALQRQFRQRAVEKTYLALVHGRLAEVEGQIVAPIGRDPANRKRMAVVPGAREAITAYRVRQFLFVPGRPSESYTLVEIDLHTGRTHQIRVHFAHIHHPVVGDLIYGRRKRRLACPRQFLHACRLGFHRPGDGEWICVTTPLPVDLQQVLDSLQVVQ